MIREPLTIGVNTHTTLSITIHVTMLTSILYLKFTFFNT